MDIREYKKELRTNCKKFRKSMKSDYKKKLDEKITRNFLNSDLYKNCLSLFCYVSTDIEVNTKEIISKALSDGKTVAVPRCIKGTRLMDFIKITSFDDLEEGSYGVLEPREEFSEKLLGDSDTVCLIPALTYDKSGYRLGYGGGYYDRFLSEFKGISVGIIYSQNITQKLIHGKYDVPVSFIISQTSIKKTSLIKNS